MSWILLALLAHAGNGLVFIIDKGILGSGTPIGEPWRLAYYSGLVSGLAAALLLVAWMPLTLTVALWSVVAGVCFVLALWCFFAALQAGESSRVVPLIGSAVAVLTWLLAAVFLGEELGGGELLGAALLVVGGVVLSVQLSAVRGLSGRLVGLIIAGGLAFAAYFTVVKFIYAQPGLFLGLFAYSRVGVMVAAVVLFGPWMWRVRRNGGKRKKPSKKAAEQRWTLRGAFVTSKVLGSGSFLLQSYAIQLGSVTVVNALQGTQYVLVLVVALLLSRWKPKVWQEERGRVALAQKVVGISIISVGLLLLV